MDACQIEEPPLPCDNDLPDPVNIEHLAVDVVVHLPEIILALCVREETGVS